MLRDHRSQEVFAFLLANKFLETDTGTEEAFVSNQIAVLTGGLLFAVIVLLGFIIRGNY